jgi:opacity protein-like surface antigen
VCATTAKAGGDQAGWYISTDGGINFLESFDHVSTEPGVRWGLEGGYAFHIASKLTLDAELESGFIYNSIRAGSHDGQDDQIPFLGNLVLKYHIGKWVPYFGAGAGGDNVNLSAGGGGYYNVDFAAQGEAGVRYELSDHIDVGLGYKYLCDFTSKNIQLSNHAFLLSATYHF